MRLLPLLLLVACTEYDLSRPPEDGEVGGEEPTPDGDGDATTDTGVPEDTEDPPNDEQVDTEPPPDTEEEDEWEWPDWWGDTGAWEDTETTWSFDEIPDDPNLPTATEEVYVNDSANLYTYDIDTNSVRWLGAFEERGTGRLCTWMVDIAIDLDGNMYGTCSTELVQIDPTNGKFVHAVDLDQEYVGLTFVSDGRLILGGNGEVNIWTPSTGQITQLADAMEYVTSGDLVGLPNVHLYWTVTGADDLVELDPNNGSTRWIGETTSSWDGYAIWGLAWARNTLYGFTSDGEVLLLDPNDASASLRATHSTSFYGATTNPVLW